MKKTITLCLGFLLLGACANDGRKDYDSMRYCHSAGYQAGTAEYDQCVKEERSRRMLEQQRAEYERQKQIDRDNRARRF